MQNDIAKWHKTYNTGVRCLSPAQVRLQRSSAYTASRYEKYSVEVFQMICLRWFILLGNWKNTLRIPEPTSKLPTMTQ